MARRALRAAERSELRRTVGAYFAYRTFSSANFFWPIFFVFYERYGRMELSAILVLQSFHWIARFALEIPLGLVFERMGRRATLVGGAALAALGCGLTIAQSTPAGFYVGSFVLAAAAVGRSGADRDLLFERLSRFGQAEDWPSIVTRSDSLATVAGIMGALASGWLLEWWLPLPYVLTFAAQTAAVVAAIVLVGARPDPARPRAQHGAARASVGEIARSPAVLWIVGLYVLLDVLSRIVLSLQQPYLESVGVPVVLFGVVVAAARGAEWAVARNARRVETRLSPGGVPTVLLTSSLVPLGLLGLTASPVGAAFVSLRGVVDGLSRPIVNSYLNRVVAPARRANVFSTATLLAALAQAVVLAGCGFLLAGRSVGEMLRFVWLAGLAASLVLLWVAGRTARAALDATPIAADRASALAESEPSGRELRRGDH